MLAVETGIPHQFIADLDASMIDATLDYLDERADLQRQRARG